MGALSVIGLLIGSFLYAKEGLTPDVPAGHTRDLDGIMRDSSKYSPREMKRRIRRGDYK